MAELWPTYAQDGSSNLHAPRSGDDLAVPLKTKQSTSSEIQADTIDDGDHIYDTDEDRAVFGPLKRYLVGFRDVFIKRNSIEDLIGDIPGFWESLFGARPTRNVMGFYPDTEEGGGEFVWKPNLSKSNHNGGTVINPDHNSTIGSSGWYSSTGDGTDDTGSGCWVRLVKNRISITSFGVEPDSVDKTNIIKLIIDIIKSSKYDSIIFEKGEYIITDLIKFTKDCKPIMKEGAYFNVSSFDTGTQTGGWVHILDPDYPIRPEWFGAVGDGSANDSYAIQKALDTAIDPDMDAIGESADPNHATYNSIKVEFAGGKEYYIGTDTIDIRSEHHFLGLEIVGSSPSDYNSFIRGDGTGTCFNVIKPDNISGTGAQTTKRFSNLGIRLFDIGISFDTADQSNFVTDCRFQQIDEACVYGVNCDNLQVKNNTFNDCAGGYLVQLIAANLCQVIGNVTGESTAQSAGVYIDIGSARGGNIVSENSLRGGQIYVDSNGVTTVPVLISDNIITDSSAVNGDASIYVSNNVRKSNITSNVITSSNSIDGIRIFDGKVSDNNITVPDIGINSGGFGTITQNNIYDTTIGINVDRGASPTNAYVSFNVIDNAGTGINVIESEETTIVANKISNCTDAINGGTSWQRGLVALNTFIGNTTDDSTYKPTGNREHDFTNFVLNFYPDLSESLKMRSGNNPITVSEGTYTNAPIDGTWKRGDRVYHSSPSAGGNVGWVCVSAGTPGTWKSFGTISA